MRLRPATRGRLLSLTLLLALVLALPHYATAERGGAQPTPAAMTPFLPALIVVPADDGLSVFVRAGGLGQLSGQVFSNLRLGPTGHKGSYTMVYSDTLDSYVTSVPGFSATQTVNATLSITTTAGLDSGELVFTRGLMRAGEIGELTTEDGGLSLLINNPGTFTADTYIAAAPSYAPPDPPPNGRRLAGRSYSLRASNAQALTDLPMSLRLYYDPGALTPEELASLAIYVWDPEDRQWDAAGSAISSSQTYVSAPIRRFTFYALMAAAPAEAHEQLFLPFVMR
jgi:hypothetical protein